MAQSDEGAVFTASDRIKQLNDIDRVYIQWKCYQV